MTGEPRQLPLDLPHEPSFAREDFLSAPANAQALRAIDAWPDWAGRMLLLIGPAGSGKSHLGAIWARAAQAVTIEAEALLEASPAELARSKALLIENADRVGAGEANLFHLFNLARESGAYLLLTARGAPDNWGLEKPDLRSRLRLAPVVALGEPDAELARAVLFKLFSDRQLAVEPAVIAYIALRIDRSLGAARAIVEALDREALARGKAVTRSMAALMFKDAEDGG
ncbi:DnaA ATPase domain-containing protein [Methylocapsa sp. S129]|uniref:DnaA ATPase domain-containing protein n=1 Tax=Methylocapsa sp. S129 TaxID=1641869 RepID=UPI00131ADD9A|nr:DnaA/Hda family protein [Methylocapsa sp. S129]